ncbi:long-chain-fatty-acid--CoA ligase [Laceyella putida]|uniref:Long-chain-fatty-acid--CoA ligase n=1 Tax=Laceyella putida TaxID=110101 RepID=A0ABW2RLT0_9BACL
MILTKALIRAAKNEGKRTAVVDGDVTLTYGELAERVSRLKQALKAQGIGKGDRVALLLFNDFRYLELFYAVTALGAIVVPLNFRLGRLEIVELLQDCTPKAFFFHPEFAPMLPQIAMRVMSIRLFVRVDGQAGAESGFIKEYESLLRGVAPQPLTYDGVAPDDVAGIFYTGGTTGRPKGVMLTHANLVSNAYHGVVAFRFDRSTKYLHAAPMFHLADGACTFAVTLVGGAHHHLRAFQPGAFLEWVGRHKPTACLLVPTMVNLIVNDPHVEEADCSSLRQLVYGGSPMPVEVLQKAQALWPHISFIQGYGMSEAAPLVTTLAPEDHQPADSVRLASCGQPIVGVEVKLVDERGNEAGVGEVGEIIVRGPNVMKGYWNQPELTAEAIRDGWYHSGDLAYRDEEHYFYIVDRKKDMIVTGGENVYSVEVEQVLYRHPVVVEAAVIGVPDPVWGEAVKAIVVKRNGPEADEQALIDFCRRQLAGFKVPKSVEWVDELPKSGAGKILKRKLREAYWAGREKKVN